MIAVMRAVMIDCNDGYYYYSQTAAVINITSVNDDINQYGSGCVCVYTAETRTVMTVMTVMTIIIMHACNAIHQYHQYHQ